jgi:nicotinamide-nucleotide amidase
MIAEILATGDELRTGALVDSNSAQIAEALTANGIEVVRHHTVGDDMGRLIAVIREIAGRADVAVVTGGLGPTVDDLTAEAMAKAGGVALVEDSKALADIEAYFARRHRPVTAPNRKQALLPEGAAALYNPVGTAPGLRLKIDRCLFFCMPGVPFEMTRMLADQVLPQILALQGHKHFCLIRTIATFGLPESVVGEKVAEISTAFPRIKLGLRAKFPEIQVKLYLDSFDQAEGEELLVDATTWVADRLGAYIFSLSGESLPAVVGRLLKERNATLALAESCTGGLVANWLTDIPGASDFFLLSAVTYANNAKQEILGVPLETMIQNGAVHEKTAEAMAEGARRISGADWGLSITGIAGPSGGSPEKPVGTVCIAVATARGTISERRLFSYGKRLMNKRMFAMSALDMLRRMLESHP